MASKVLIYHGLWLIPYRCTYGNGFFFCFALVGWFWFLYFVQGYRASVIPQKEHLGIDLPKNPFVSRLVHAAHHALKRSTTM